MIQNNMRRFKLWDNIAGWMVFAIATISYLLTMEPTTSMWDCSEFIATSYKLEVGHPPGAPLFMMLARVASLFAPDVESVAACINAMNCIASGFCIMFLFWTITHLVRRITHRPDEDMSLEKMLLILGSGAVGALAYAYTDTFWFSAVEGEVYALSSMFTALVVWLMLKWEENAHRHTSMRWIILIAYLMGLSIGVHILNLLTIPALVMIWFFRRVEFGGNIWVYLLKMCGALLGSFLILGAINGIIIPYTVALGAAVDTFAVNTLGMPVNAGMILFVVVVFGALAALVWFTHRRRYRILNGVVLAFTVILIGFGSYAAVAIRANANPPMNSNNPSNPHSLLSLLNRDQYGNRPLVVGPYYSATPLPMVVHNDDVTSDDQYVATGDFKSKTMTWLNPETGKYEKREIFDDYIYPSEARTLFPRMWWHSRAKQYEAEWVTLEDGHPSKVVTDKDGNRWYEPTKGEDIGYFLDYQMGDMFVRYFMWNFVGRQDDVQLTSDGFNGIYTHGGWISGIDFIDELFTGPTTNLPSEQRNNAAHNTYFFLPLLLGLLGVIYQLSCDWRNFIVVALLYTMMGVALVVYFNTCPGEPRERDYVYAGAFYAFSIWIGIGAAAIAHLCSSAVSLLKIKSRALPAVAVGVGLLLSASVPAVLASENWDDHDRSHRYYTRDLGRNYLNTAPKNAILMNFGDNDTFPIWYCQEVEGLRPDVRVMNTSYLGGEWYIDEMKLAANGADGVPFTIPSSKYSFVNDYIIVAHPIDLLMGDANEKMRRDVRRILNVDYYNINTPDGAQESYTFDELNQLHNTLLDIFYAYDSEEFHAYIEGRREVPEERYAEFNQYVEAMLLLEEIDYNTTFLRDMETVALYETKYSKLNEADILLKDAIRLFNHDGASPKLDAPAEERALLLIINDGMMRIVERDSEIPVEERKEDFEIMGRLNPKADNFIDGTESDYIIAARNYIIPVDKDAAIAAGIVEESDRERLLDNVTISIPKDYLTRDYLMMLDLFANFEWKRPLAFTQPYIMRDYGIADYARYDGFCYSFVPIKTRYVGGEAGYIDIDKLYPLFMGEHVEGSLQKPLAFGNIAAEGVLADYFVRYNISATRIREGFARVASGFIDRGYVALTNARKTADGAERERLYAEAQESMAKAERLLDRGIKVLPADKIDHTYDNTMPYVRGYYYLAATQLTEAISCYERAVVAMNSLLGTSQYAEESYDDMIYFDNLSRCYEELRATAAHRGIEPSTHKALADAEREARTAEELYALCETIYTKGDVVAAKFIAKRGEWAKYYLQFGSVENFSPMVNRELNLAVMDIVDVLSDTKTLAGSYDWVANPKKGEALTENALKFDSFVLNYVRTINSLTPRSVRDTQFALMEPHIFNLYEIYYSLDRSDTIYHKDLVKFLNRSEVRAVVEAYAEEYGFEVIAVE